MLRHYWCYQRSRSERCRAAGTKGVPRNGPTGEADAIEKNITPLGGFPHYGEVNYDFLLIKGAVQGTRKRPIVLRKPIFPTTKSWQTEKCEIKFIDTASKIGHGRFQTAAEKDKILGTLASKNRQWWSLLIMLWKAAINNLLAEVSLF